MFHARPLPNLSLLNPYYISMNGDWLNKNTIYIIVTQYFGFHRT